MKDLHLLTLSILLFLWLGTVLWFFLYWRRHRVRPQPASSAVDFLLTLASEKAREAKAAQNQLYKTADLLRVGLLVLSGTDIRGLNAFGEQLADLLKNEGGAMPRLRAMIETGDAVTLELPSVVLQCELLRRDEALTDMPETVIVAQDVTQSFELARELQYRERLAILGRMTAQIAHQLKTPLAVLAGRAQLLATGRHEMALPEGMRRQLLLLYEEARSLAQRINDIVSLYRNTALNVRPVQVLQVLNAVRERLLELEHECEILVKCDETLKAMGDRAALEMALFLLGQNAVLPGTAAQHLYLRAQIKEGRVVVEIEDDGKGISSELQSRIFEPFVSGRSDGLGLGLFLAKDLVKRMKGELELVSTGSNGTCFRLILVSVN